MPSFLATTRARLLPFPHFRSIRSSVSLLAVLSARTASTSASNSSVKSLGTAAILASLRTFKFDHDAIQKKWKARWGEQKKVTEDATRDGTPMSATRDIQPKVEGEKEKFYMLSMFPYPSGYLHMGHVRVYTITDTLARFHKLRGAKVINPMGWDAFGLPAENAAIERSITPADWTESNITVMRSQMELLGCQFDWDREVMTCRPDYYRWTQEIFLELWRRGLAYQKDSAVNWDPVDETVLANEQVDPNGRSWRSGAQVIQRRLRQWFFRITDYAGPLFDDLELLRNRWPERVLAMQSNWISQSHGAEVQFPIDGLKDQVSEDQNRIVVFTSRPETLFGVEYLCLAPEHWLVNDKFMPADVVKAAEVLSKSRVPEVAASKEGIASTLYAIHPITNERVPIYIAPYVLPDYGTGAVMGVPAHDERDWAFAKERGINNVRVVIEPNDREAGVVEMPYTAKSGRLTSICGKYSGLDVKEAADRIIADGKFGKQVTRYKLRDWLVSRQRYWGAPIPIIHCPTCETVPVPTEDLPVLLPPPRTHVSTTPINGQESSRVMTSPLSKNEEWIRCKCPKCGGQARRETDTMDTFVDSSWYFLRFTDPKNLERPFSHSAATSLLPVDVYVGGIEHAILHLLYARFISKFLWKAGMFGNAHHAANMEMTPTAADEMRGEPFKKLLTQGMVHGRTYKDPQTGRFLKPDEVDISDPNNPKMINGGQTPAISFEKMSKSKYNGVDPAETVRTHGADATRLHILFSAPPEDVLEWDDAPIVGMQRFLWRVGRLALIVSSRLSGTPSSSFEVVDHNGSPLDMTKMNRTEQDLYRTTEQTVAHVTECLMDTYNLNTVVSELVKLCNLLTGLHPSLPVGAKKKTKTKKKPGELSVETPIRISESILDGLGDAPFDVSPVYERSVRRLIMMLAPLAPHTCEELWEGLNPGNEGKGTIFCADAWPVLDQAALDFVVSTPCTVTVNGKFQFIHADGIPAEITTDTTAVARLLRNTKDGEYFLKGKMIKKVIVVQGGKIVNFVTA